MAFLSESTGRVKGGGGDVDLFWGDGGSSSMLLSLVILGSFFEREMMSGGAFEIEYVVVKCFGGSYIYTYVCVVCI